MSTANIGDRNDDMYYDTHDMLRDLGEENKNF